MATWPLGDCDLPFFIPPTFYMMNEKLNKDIKEQNMGQIKEKKQF